MRPNLEVIAAALKDLQGQFEVVNRELTVPRTPLSDAVISNLVLGYAYIDQQLLQGDGLLKLGKSAELLELNGLVLYGDDPAVRREQSSALKLNRRRFYDDSEGGVGQLMEWLKLHRQDNPWKQAAGVYIRTISQPQLFMEGNHRTGALLMSYLLMKAGLPPFVLSLENARAHFEPSTLAVNLRKDGFKSLLMIPKIKKRLAKNLKASASDEFLIPPAQ